MTTPNDNNKELHLNAGQEAAYESVVKSFVTGTGITPDTQHDAAALRRESLADQVRTLTYQNEDFTIYPLLKRINARSTVEKYAIQQAHGKTGHSRFTREIGIANINTPVLRQKTVQMKFLSDTKQISIAAGIVNNIADPMDILTDDALAVLIKTIEWASFYGDASLSNDPDAQSGLEFDGLERLIDRSNVLDAKGDSLTPEMMNQAAVIVGKGFGRVTDAFMPIGVLADFSNSFHQAQRVVMPTTESGYNAGVFVNAFNSTRGTIKLHGSTIMDNDDILDEERPLQENAPAPAESVSVEVVQNAKGKFRDVDRGVGHVYKVVVFSDDAESRAVSSEDIAVDNETDAIKVTVKLSNLYSALPQFIAIYRKANDTNQYHIVKRIPVSAMTDEGTLEFTDVNAKIPGTADIFMGSLTTDVIALYELLPMMRLPLAVYTSANTFSVLWYGALALFAPKKWVHIKNVNYVQAPMGNPFYSNKYDSYEAGR